MIKKVYISCDHTGLNLVDTLVQQIKNKGIEVFVLSALEGEDYTDIAKKVAISVQKELTSCGILVCGSGIGVSIVANRFKGIRAALCHSQELASLARKHNDANILCLGARMQSTEEQIKILNTFLETDFEGERHFIRIKKIDNID